jgi:hypothetical protein
MVSEWVDEFAELLSHLLRAIVNKRIQTIQRNKGKLGSTHARLKILSLFFNFVLLETR